MSSALSASQHPDTSQRAPRTEPHGRHLRSVSEVGLVIDPISTIPATDIRQAAHLDQAALDPREEFAPSEELGMQPGQSHVFNFRKTVRQDHLDYRHEMLLADIKKMTQTIGAAFIEAELGIRPFTQLRSWIELELFHKLQARVHHSAFGKYLAARRGEAASRKVPSIVPIGVRAAMQTNGEWESSMTVRVGERARAIAMRLQLHRDRWRVIAFEVG